MVSHSSFRVMGYVYAGLCLTSSLLLVINTGSTISGRNEYGSYVSSVGIIALIVSLTSMIFNLILVFGMVTRRVDFVKYHLRYVCTVYGLLMIGLFVGCVVGGIAVAKSAGRYNYEEASLGVIGITFLCTTFIVMITLCFSLIAWILNGMIGSIQHEAVRSILSDDSEREMV